ncbi:hypothetical protein AJ88_09305 [Mesorhizobium amorphae CCBAU 01583]|nr:hypothetical protein AJ88_09305 [Mesorhizobium amorphae CCBAU 01583]
MSMRSALAAGDQITLTGIRRGSGQPSPSLLSQGIEVYRFRFSACLAFIPQLPQPKRVHLAQFALGRPVAIASRTISLAVAYSPASTASRMMAACCGVTATLIFSTFAMLLPIAR